jgi:hypothetical protein
MTLYQELKLIDDFQSSKKIVEFLRTNPKNILIDIFTYTYDQNIEWLISKDKEFNYTPIDVNDRYSHNTLRQEIRKLPMYMNIGNYPNMLIQKRDELFTRLLSDLHKDDVHLLLSMKNRELPFDYLTKDVILEAYPNLIQKWERKS